MQRELLMPKLGLTMTEGSVAQWSVGAGEPFQSGQALYVVETDKVATEIAADHDGTLIEIIVQVGDMVPVGTVIGYWDDGGPAVQATAIQATATPATATPAAATPATAAKVGDRIVASPFARHLAGQSGLDLASLAGSGPGGRIVARDVLAAGMTRQKESTTVNQAALQPALQPAAQPGMQPELPYQVIAPTTRQATIARRLTRGKQDTPHFYLALEAEVSSLTALRKEVNEADLGIRLTLNHFIVKAVVMALLVHPELNRAWSDAGILAFRQIDVGVAIDTANGLQAPALTNTGGLPIKALADRLTRLAERARAGALTANDMGMPAITVSNAGMHHVTYMTSIINPGQSMILGVGSIKGVFRPDPHGQPELRQELGLVLSADHRIMDGVAALKFLNTIIHYLEHPAQLLLH